MQESVNKDRDKYIGGSDIPIIMNLSPYKSRYDLLLEKAGYKEDTFKGNIYTEYGNKMESKIRDYLNRISDGAPFIEGKHVREAQGDEIIGVRIHTDGERAIDIGTEVLEVKTTDKIYKSIKDYKIYLVQLLFYMVNTGAESGILAVYERPEDLSEEFNNERLFIYPVYPINQGYFKNIVDEMERAIDLFIEDLKKVKANPFISEEELTPQEIPDLVNLIISLSQNRDNITSEIDTLMRSLYKALESMLRKRIKTPSGDIVNINGDSIVIISDKDNRYIERRVSEAKYED